MGGVRRGWVGLGWACERSTTVYRKNCFQEDKKFSHKIKFMIPKFNSCHLFVWVFQHTCILCRRLYVSEHFCRATARTRSRQRMHENNFRFYNEISIGVCSKIAYSAQKLFDIYVWKLRIFPYTLMMACCSFDPYISIQSIFSPAIGRFNAPRWLLHRAAQRKCICTGHMRLFRVNRELFLAANHKICLYMSASVKMRCIAKK